MALGKPGIPVVRSGDDRGLATAVQNIRQRIEAIEAEINVLSGGGLASLLSQLGTLQRQVGALVSGALTPSFSNQEAGTVFAGPVSGNAAAPAFRALEWYYDLPLYTTTPFISGLDGSEAVLVERYGNFYWTTVADIAAGAGPEICLAIACSDESTSIAAGTNKVRFINPYSTAFVLSQVVGSLNTAQASGSTFTVDINENGVSILSTKLTIDNGEKTSGTAAVPPVISDTSIAPYAEVEIDVDTVGDGTAAGLKVYLIGRPA